MEARGRTRIHPAAGDRAEVPDWLLLAGECDILARRANERGFGLRSCTVHEITGQTHSSYRSSRTRFHSSFGLWKLTGGATRGPEAFRQLIHCAQVLANQGSFVDPTTFMASKADPITVTAPVSSIRLYWPRMATDSHGFWVPLFRGHYTRRLRRGFVLSRRSWRGGAGRKTGGGTSSSGRDAHPRTAESG